MMAAVSALDSTSNSPFRPILNPLTSCSGSDCSGSILVVLVFIVVTPICFSSIHLGTSIRGTSRSAGGIGDCVKRRAHRAINDFKTFGLRAHCKHVSGLARQIEKAIANGDERPFKVALDRRKSSDLAGFDLVLPFFAAAFCGGQSSAFGGELVGIGAASSTGGDLPHVSNISEPHL